ncbi:hypothetical protein OEZ49_08830 [Ruegeria sp. WL0004]|uniref:RiboL-PSP-HEPN domain-containing protein n=1 Tax=Ruegeria marisflavi TaxID=2984152 RepID=A0ABT2WPN3_9RHOB|nr:hypothetical protein [Ruegeria sp. WL0004]MCU9837870.1 hypothetical protein [Ruegeria sp. WL0004]
MTNDLAPVRESAWSIIDLLQANSWDAISKISGEEVNQIVEKLCLHLNLVCRGVDSLLLDHSNECAAILMRSAFEATMRAAYIATSAPDEASKLAQELAITLPKTQNYRLQKRAADVVSFSGAFSDNFAKVVFSRVEKDAKSAPSVLSKTERNALDQKWAFTRILPKVEKSLCSLGFNFPLSPMLYDYGICSNYLHADGIGLGLEADQATRSATVALLKLDAEAVKIYQNMIACWVIVHVGILACSNSLSKFPLELLEMQSNFSKLANPISERFAGSQKEFYEGDHEPA